MPFPPLLPVARTVVAALLGLAVLVLLYDAVQMYRLGHVSHAQTDLCIVLIFVGVAAVFPWSDK